MKGIGWLISALGLILIGVAGLVLLGSGLLSGVAVGGTSVERGQWIFQTGSDPSGQPISYSGGMGMMQGGCASCHGPNGHGLRTMMFVSPNITYRNLTDPAGFLEPDGTRGPAYTEDQVRRAVTQGLDPEGQSLNWPMPRWQLTDPEWNDLLAYLKVLP